MIDKRTELTRLEKHMLRKLRAIFNLLDGAMAQSGGIVLPQVSDAYNLSAPFAITGPSDEELNK